MASAGKGLPFIGKMNEFLGRVLHPTVQKVGNSRAAIEVIHKGYYLLNPSPSIPYTVEAGSTDNLVVVTGHNLKVGDMVRLLSTTNSIKEFEIIIDEIVDANSFKLAGYLSASLEAGDTFDCLRAVSERFAADGSTLASLTTPPVSYNRKVGGTTTPTFVLEDLDTPANSRAMPVVLHGVDAASITISSGDLNISSSHVNDSMAIGNGVDKIVGVTTNNELKVNDNDLLTELKIKADPTEKQYVSIVGDLDPNNTTTTPLGAGATYTGTWTSTVNYSAVALGVMANVNSATDGLKYQFSHDGVSVHHEHTYTYIADTYGSGYSVPVEFRYYRVVYINGASAQSSFLISSTLKQTASFPSSYKVVQTITDQSQALMTRSVIVGQTTGGGPGGGYTNVKVNPSGALTTESTLAASAGTRIGTVAIDQTTDGSTNKVNIGTNGSVTLLGANNLIGKVSIDQVTANANEVVVKSITAGTNLIGKFSIDQVTANANEVVVKSITAGSNLIGKVSIDQSTPNANEVVVKSITAGTNNIGKVTIDQSVVTSVTTKETAQVASHVQSLTIDGTTAQTFTAPTGARWVKIQADDDNIVSLKVAFGTTASATVGHKFAAGRSEDFSAVANISVIAISAATNQGVYITWGV